MLKTGSIEPYTNVIQRPQCQSLKCMSSTVTIFTLEAGENTIDSSYFVNDENRNRCWMLHRIKTDLRSSPQVKVEHPSNKCEYLNREVSKLEDNPLLEEFPTTSLPLPLPDTSEWGV